MVLRGKGNDQVRFELSYYALNPAIKVAGSWKTQEFWISLREGRNMLNYARAKNITCKGLHSKALQWKMTT